MRAGDSTVVSGCGTAASMGTSEYARGILCRDVPLVGKTGVSLHAAIGRPDQ